MSDQYYYLLDGKEHGPFSRAAIDSLVAGGKLSGALLRSSPEQPWQTVEEIGLAAKPQPEPQPVQANSNDPAAVVFRSQGEVKAAKSGGGVGVVIGGLFLVAIAGVGVWVTGTNNSSTAGTNAHQAPSGSTPSTQGEEDDSIWALDILLKQLKSPSTFQLVSKRTVWTGIDARAGEGNRKAYIVRIEYDAQNSFGAMIRGCAYVAFSIEGEVGNGKYHWNDRHGVQSCQDDIFTEAQAVALMQKSNFAEHPDASRHRPSTEPANYTDIQAEHRETPVTRTDADNGPVPSLQAGEKKPGGAGMPETTRVSEMAEETIGNTPETALKAVFSPSATYPQAELRNGIGGTVVLIVSVRPDGSVAEAIVEKSSRNRNLDSAALTTAAQWRFEPSPSSAQLRIPFEFNLYD